MPFVAEQPCAGAVAIDARVDLVEQLEPLLARLGLQQCVLAPRARVVDVELVGRHHVVVAAEHDGDVGTVQRRRVRDQSIEPA